MQHYPARIERLGAFHLSTFLQNQLQDVADILIRTKHICLHNRLTNFPDHAWVGQVSRVIDRQFFSADGDHFIDDTWTCSYDVHVILAPEPFLDDLHVKQPEKSAAKSKSERDGTFRLIDERGIIQTQFRDCCLQMFEVAGIDRINSTENHGMNFLKTWKRFARGMTLVGYGIADLHIGGCLNVRDEITDIARIQLFLWKHLWCKDPNFLDLVARTITHQR